MLDARGNDQLFADFRASIARKTRGFLAPEYNIQCIEAAANLPFDEGLKVEGKLFMELMTGPQSGAQRYAFFAERAANKIPDIAKDTPIIDVQKCGVLGAGTMGGGIAMNFANVGIPVTIVERDQAALDRGLGVVRKNYERSASRGSIPPEAVEQRMALITGSTDKADFADCDMVIEAVFENMELKKSIFKELDEICKPGAVLASNTSALDINEIACGHVTPRERDRHALLLARQRDEAARERARRQVVRLGRRHHDGDRQEDRQGAGDGRRVPRLRRQPHAVHARRRGRADDPRRRHARRRSTTCSTSSGSRWARSR